MSRGQADRRRQKALAPHTGGKPIPEAVQNAVRMRVLNHARDKYAGKYQKIDVRFDDDLCFIDAFRNPEPGSEVVAALTHETREQYVERIRNTPVHLVRLAYFDEDRWGRRGTLPIFPADVKARCGFTVRSESPVERPSRLTQTRRLFPVTSVQLPVAELTRSESREARSELRVAGTARLCFPLTTLPFQTLLSFVRKGVGTWIGRTIRAPTQ